ncbi:hypothetical protein J7302_05040 [Pseudomonas sp. DB1]|uniref:Uncharacterized protein n=1 Tax=Metapseudomonas boanensis TaxID=2822138 RepID=A0ABS5XGN1_9GAMM|nr:hypothetical protein [Pseudomonas boanensis]
MRKTLDSSAAGLSPPPLFPPFAERHTTHRAGVFTRQSPIRPVLLRRISIHPVNKAQQLLRTQPEVSNPEVRKITLHLLHNARPAPQPDQG